ncbi:hypothetical protein OKA04_03765 [Luteolibacter flavescens]|uniref:Uncharacterized protein n=1 Tax=Luteolibacter flavescens TaxID=1859460 RepID=A0ABT3FJV3_9BACT|nr:hypothetical protein [Luteolibacter flavescens]MCW1883830.1 hypothetical protein [Luteolibacter flavescens]
MKLSFSLSSLLACAFWTAAAVNSSAESSPYRGLWVGEVALGKVNEVTVPLDAQNIPRAPDPATPTPTFDAANFRVIVHVDAMGRASLLKQVAILARKADLQKTESDMALVTDERLYGSFPPQAATRISSAVFDFGDAKATAAVNAVIERAASAAATAATQSGATKATIKTAAQNAATPVIAQADAAQAFTTFLRNHLDATKVRAIANGGSTSAARTAADALKSGSFYQDTRGTEVLDAIQATLAALPSTATQQQREQAALNAAASFIETSQGYERFLASELIGDAITDAAAKAASTAESIPFAPITGFETANGGAAVAAVSPAHGLVTGDEIAIQGAGLSSYNGLHKVTRIDDNKIRLATPFVTGGAIGGFAASDQIAPVRVTSPAHGLADGTRITVRGSLAGYNGSHLITVVDANTFTIPVVFSSDPVDRGLWSVKSGSITNFESAPGGTLLKVVSPNHGLNNGQAIDIQGSGQASYNGSKVITRIDADSFTIPVVFGGNPAVKGSWDLPKAIDGIAPPASVPTRITFANHGLSTGDRIVISGSAKEDYNGEQVVEVIDSGTFSIGIPWDSTTGDPGVKGTWAPAPGGQWRRTAAIRAALDQVAKVAAARTQAANTKLSDFPETRAPDALEVVLSSIIAEAALSASPLAIEIGAAAEAAGRAALSDSVARYPRATATPSTDYSDFVRSSTFSGSVAIAAEAAATAALKEKADLLATTASIKDKATEAAINALSSVLSTAARSLLTELPMTGDFGDSIATEIVLPANHPTNPFRHRRHPDHTSGIDIRRLVNLSFQATDGEMLSRTGYGVDRISGTYAEEIFGLHKPLGPSKNIGLKVAGTFQLHRISLIDTLNGR